jgi:hypothetical protein
MAIAASAGYHQHSGTYVPNKKWSKRLLARYYRTTVWQVIANTVYEDEIRGQGDTIVIRTSPNVQVVDVKKGSEMNFQNPKTTTIDLEISKAKGFAFNIDDIDRWQSDLDIQNEFQEAANFQMNIEIDKDILGYTTPLANAKNKGASAGANSGNFNMGTTGAPIGLNEDNILSYICDAATVLNEQTVPHNDRYMLLPPWAVGLLRKSKLEDEAISQISDGGIIRTGKVHQVHGFTLYQSQSLTTVTDGGVNCTSIMFGQKDALTFAGELTKLVGPIQAEKSFVHRMMGLFVYGRKVIKDEALGELYAYRETI